MSDKRQKSQQMAFRFDAAGEARRDGQEGTGTLMAGRATESPAQGIGRMEEVCERENLSAALKRVQVNKGSPGIDGMTVDELPGYLKQHWPAIRERLMSGTYKPQPVKRVEIPKPDGGVRKSGVPTVVDRLIQQAVLQVLQQSWDPTFSDSSFGFRPGRSQQFIATRLKLRVNEAKSAVAKPQQRKFPGFSFYISQTGPKRSIASKSLERFKERIRKITLGSKGRSMKQTMDELAPYIRGWAGYYGFCETPWVLKDLDKWIRRRLRCAFWQQWKTGHKRYRELVKRGVYPDKANNMAGSNRGPWHLSLSKAMSVALPNAELASLGLPSLIRS